MSKQPLRWEPVEIVLEPADDDRPVLLQGASSGVTPAGPGVDLAWRNEGLYLLKEPGKARRMRFGQFNGTIADVRFDGRYGWVVLNNMVKPVLAIVDPRTERLWGIGAGAGLPATSGPNSGVAADAPMLWTAPLEPGRAILVSWFGRLAVAEAKFDPAGSSKVEVFFEARQKPEPGNWRMSGKDPKNAFRPTDVHLFRGVDAAGRPLLRSGHLA